MDARIIGEMTGMSPNPLQPISHGCVHIAPKDIDVLAKIPKLSPGESVPMQSR